MSRLSVKKGDKVLVIAGKDKGKQAKVIAANPKQSRVLVEGVNIISKTQKAKSAQEKSAIVKKEAPVDVSNVQVVCPKCGKATRVAHKIVDGKNVRVCKKCNAVLDVAVTKTKKSDKKSVKPEVKEEAKTVPAVKEKTTSAKEKATTVKKAVEKTTVKKIDAKAKKVKSQASKKV